MSYFQYQGNSCFYKEYGQGKPIIFLHGNTGSSNMFKALVPLYVENFRCILIDFLGNGQSDRVSQFSPDIWHDEALQTIALIEHLNCGKVGLIGTSGGAWAAVNTGLERPDLVEAIIADSFDGRTLNDNFIDNLITGRKNQSKIFKHENSMNGVMEKIGRMLLILIQKLYCNVQTRNALYFIKNCVN